MKKLWKSKTFLILLPFITIPLAYLAKSLYVSYIIPLSQPCLFNKLTGYYCPGCGNTRAVLAIMSGKILKSIGYNPLPTLLLCIAVVHYIWTLRGKKPPLSGAFVLITMSIMLIYYILRNFIPISPYLPPTMLWAWP